MNNCEIFDIIFVIYKNKEYIEKMKFILSYYNIKNYQFIRLLKDDEFAISNDPLFLNNNNNFKSCDKINYLTNYYIWNLVCEKYNNCLVLYENEKYIKNEKYLKFLLEPHIFFWHIIFFIENDDIECYALTCSSAKILLNHSKPMKQKLTDYLIDNISKKRIKNGYICENNTYCPII